jgi:Family of unknown function (DUF6088)
MARTVITLKRRIIARLNRKKGVVVLRSDFEDLGGYDQVGRVLRELVKEAVLVRIGKGIYAKAKRSPLTGEIVPVGGIIEATKEALKKLGIKILPSSLQSSYNANQSTQVPTGRIVGTNKRVRRNIRYGNVQMSFEYVASE